MNALAMTLPAHAGVRVGEVARELTPLSPRVIGDAAVRVTGVRQDSRQVEPGELFVVRAGKAKSGADFVAEAVARGAVALLVEAGLPRPPVALPVIEVSDVRRGLALAAEFVYGHPSRALALVGITGTNGKTTTSLLVDHALAALGQRPARLGTLGFAFDGESSEGALTTPEADAVSRLLASVVARGGTHFVMEVSSHALSLARVDAIRFRVAAFSNLSQDHLDFYASMREYGAAKARLFDALAPECAVINIDDEFGRELAGHAHARLLTTGRAADAALRVVSATLDARGIEAQIATASAELTLRSSLIGEHNLENLLLALGILQALDIEPADAARALATAPPVPGRLERCDEDGDDISVLVDYAHTPDALERVLAALTRVTPGDVCCVFGCGGDRDPDKRPKMGAAVGRGAARAILTSDNPRSEEPAAIAAAVEVGLRQSGSAYEIELDRARAIELAVLSARPGDSVLLAGKGHETYQIIGSERRVFDDRVEARRALALRRAGKGV
jgi:UDP-N-acetylmuramoyl-L-alanyl-D-glutamate--2,6-diaminopimelate ligase